MENKTVSVPSISCGHCVMTIEKALKALPGVSQVQASAESKEVNVSWEAPATWEQISQTLSKAGYPAE